MTNKPLLLLAALACGFAALPGCDRSASADNPSASTSASASPAPADGLDTLFSIAPFTLTDQDNQPFGTEQLKGKTWIASLFFTTCPGPCPMMQGRLNAIEDAVQNPNVLIVSVSVDPEHDTPEKMKAYAKRMGVDEH
ncbi:MAG: SCO family protein, partial [Tepidisphaeraceae bacterium]